MHTAETRKNKQHRSRRNKKELSSTNGVREIKCPFFRQHNDREIHCEGIMDNCSNALVFRAGERKTFYQHTYCEGRYQACEIYRMLMHEKYEDD